MDDFVRPPAGLPDAVGPKGQAGEGQRAFRAIQRAPRGPRETRGFAEGSAMAQPWLGPALPGGLVDDGLLRCADNKGVHARAARQGTRIS